MSAPINIEGLPVIHEYIQAGDGRVENVWAYYPTREEKEKEGLRIELVTYTSSREGDKIERHEARLAKGPVSEPKHLHVIRIRNWTALRLGDAAWRLRQEFFQKGW